MLVTYEFDDHISRITLQRPEKRNALSSQVLLELSQAVDQAHDEKESRLTIVQATGPVFCAGMDLKEMQARADSPDAVQLYQADSDAYRDLIVKLLDIQTPLIAAVRGPAVAGGMGIVLACDLVVADQNASFALPEPKRGIVAGMVTPLLLYRAGVSAANRTLLTLESIKADEAAQMNLIHVLTDSTEFDDRLTALCDSILSGGPDALRVTKGFLGKLSRDELVASLDASTAISAAARESDEAREGLAAFLEKRLPNWQ